MGYLRRRQILWILFLAGLGLLVVVAVASGTTLAGMRFEEMAKQATAIARVRCLGAESRWEDGEIWTETRFQVVELNKGDLSGVVKVKMIGGRVGGVRSRVEGVPAFSAGEEAYLFLWARGGEPLRVLGWSQGTFRIARDARTGVERVTQDSAAGPTFDPVTRKFRQEGVKNLPVTVFEVKLRRALSGNGER